MTEVSRRPRRVGRTDVPTVAAVVVVLALALYRTLMTQILFADGSFFLVRIVDTRWFIFDSGRQMGNLATQLPVVAGARLLNSHSFHVMAILMGVGFILIPAVLAATAIWMSRRDHAVLAFVFASQFLLLTLGYADLGSQFVTQVFVLIATILLVRNSQPFWHFILAGILGLFTVASYQSFVLFGPVLIVMLLLRGRRGCAPVPSWMTIFLIAEFALSTMWNAWILASGQSTGASNKLVSAATDWNYYTASQHIRLIFFAAVVLGYVLLAWVTRPGTSLVTGRWRVVLWVVVTCVVSASILMWTLWMQPKVTFSLRGFVAGLIGLLGLAICLGTVRRTERAHPAWSAAPLYSLLAVGVISASTVAFQWHRFQSQFQTAMSAQTGTVSVKDLQIEPWLMSRFDWVWTNSTFGVILSHRQGVVGVRNVLEGNRTSSSLIIQIDNYGAHPQLINLPRSLRDFRW